MDWIKAEKYLKKITEIYSNTGWSGHFALMLTIYPLKKRFDNGERTQELYDEIMGLE